MNDNDRVSRAMISLEGLSTGDAFGEGFFGFGANVEFAIPKRWLPPAPWPYTDDTVMAVSITEVLRQFGRIDQDELARLFAARFAAEPDRGYGGAAMRILDQIVRGRSWREVSFHAFGGAGSMGNGSAMRVGPVGAYFAADLARAAEQAAASAEVTHQHPEGIAGAIATAVAAATAWRIGASAQPAGQGMILEAAIDLTPAGDVRDGLARATKLPPDIDPGQASAILGNGSQVTCPDTVPFCLWCADRFLHSYEEALWAAVSALGDADTNCAIVGSIVVMAVGPESIPRAWLASREALPAIP
jgi:ADP-ribosylglycohydrolase